MSAPFTATVSPDVLAEVSRLVARMARRAVKLALPPPTLRTVRTYRVPQVQFFDHDGRRRWRDVRDGEPEIPGAAYQVVERHDVELSGELPALAGWAIVAALARVETDEGAAVVVRSVPGAGELPPSFRDPLAAGDCDHCRMRRPRTVTYVLRETGSNRARRVGSSCLADFLRSGSAEDLIGYAEGLLAIREALAAGDPDDEDGGRGRQAWLPVPFLAAVVARSRRWGFVSRRQAEERGGLSTADAIAWPPTRIQCEEDRPVPVTPADLETATAALEWARDLEGLSDYLHNCRTVARMGAWTRSEIGIGASIATAYDRELARKREADDAAATSTHQGTVGKRAVFALTLLSFRVLPGDYGPRCLTKWRDAAGNRFTWYATGEHAPAEVGDTVNLKATVKAHESKRGFAETLLTRGAVQA